MDITTEEAKKAIDVWGKTRQTNMLIEEMGEFLTAWNHIKRGRITEEDYVSEIADVYIMIQQMIIIHKEIFDKVYPEKLKKLRAKLRKYDNIEDRVNTTSPKLSAGLEKDPCDVGC